LNLMNNWLAVIYFVYFAALGTLEPYLNLYYKHLGFDTYHIGLIAAVLTLTILVANPAWGAIADIFHLHKRLITVLMAGAVVVVTLLLPSVHSFFPLVAVIFCYSFFINPIVPLVDNAVVTMLKQGKYNYGRLRQWGAVGYGLAALSAGALIQDAGMKYAFIGFGLLMCAGAIINARLPAAPSLKTSSYWRDLRKLFTSPRWIIFLAGIFLCAAGMSILMNYFIIYLNGMGAGEGLFGLSVLAASISEIPVFFFSPLLLRKFKPQGVLIIASLALIARGLVYSVIRDPRLAVAAQLFHGLSFSAMWAAAVSYTGEVAPAGLGASAQAVMGAAYFGLGGAAGALIGGWLYSLVGPVSMFQIAGGIAFLGMCSFWLSGLPLFRAATSPG
jgi:MFS transporter, PPP family, 3-phenylpropionic acid transporter